MLFEFVIDGPPVSQQARNRGRVREWTQAVQGVAELRWHAQPPFDGQVMVTISYFFENVLLDVDNIPKPILDALKGLVYSDDSLVSDLLCRKRSLKEDIRIQNPSQLLLEEHAKARQFLHVSVVEALTQEI